MLKRQLRGIERITDAFWPERATALSFIDRHCEFDLLTPTLTLVVKSLPPPWDDYPFKALAAQQRDKRKSLQTVHRFSQRKKRDGSRSVCERRLAPYNMDIVSGS